MKVLSNNLFFLVVVIQIKTKNLYRKWKRTKDAKYAKGGNMLEMNHECVTIT